MPTRRLFLLLLLVPLLAWPSVADAGTYDVYSCRLPDGRPAPTYGWTPFNTRGALAHDTCAGGGSLNASLDTAPVENGTAAGWILQAPPDTQIEAHVVFRHARTDYSKAEGWSRDYYSSYDNNDPLNINGGGQEYCLALITDCWGVGTYWAPPLSPLKRLERVNLRLRRLTFQMRCVISSEPNMCGRGTNSQGDLRIFQTRITLGDDVAPTIHRSDQSVAGGGSAPLSGRVTGVIEASDTGSGLAEAVAIVDGRTQSPAPVESASCHPPYVEFRPCPLQATMPTQVDTTDLADGTHTLEFAVRDASGNESRTEPVTITVDNVPSLGAPNGVGASRFVKLRAWFGEKARIPMRTVAFGSAPYVTGQLTTASGSPIDGATVVIEQTVKRPNSSPKPVAQVVTGSDGYFRFKAPPGPSRLLTFSYTAYALDPAPVASVDVELNVRAGVLLAIAPTRVRNGTTVTFRGRLRGGPGQSRTVVTIYAISNGARKRIPVESVAANAQGRFSYRYRFSSIPGRVTFRFQAVVTRQSGYPYATGASAVKTIRGRP